MKLKDLIEQHTPISVQNKGYEFYKTKLGEKKAHRFIQQINKLCNPEHNEIIEYRLNGIVVLEKDKKIFYAFGDMDLKNWRITFKTEIQ